MKLDRHNNIRPRFRVFELTPVPLRPDLDRMYLYPPTEHNEVYGEIDPWECFVLKRRDKIARLMIAFGAICATIIGDPEYGALLSRLGDEWGARTDERGDSKMPD